MSDKTVVISSDLDGKELRSFQRGRYTRCDGRADQEQINEAMIGASSGRRLYSGLGDSWQRIFGRKG